jgi:hypothetical protein
MECESTYQLEGSGCIPKNKPANLLARKERGNHEIHPEGEGEPQDQ